MLGLLALAVGLTTAPLETPVSGGGTCAGVAGVDQLLAPGIVVLVGEIRGTEQPPRFVSALACNAVGAGFTVTVALDIPSDEAARVDAYLASAGSDADRAELLAGPFWVSGTDGRSSVAIAALLDDIRRARSAGMPLDVVLINEVGSSDPADLMAGRIADAASSNDEGIVVALMADIDAAVTPVVVTSVAPVGQQVMAIIGTDRVVALDVVHAGGTAWACAPTCGESTVQGTGPSDPAFSLSLHLGDPSSGYHGEYSVGPLSASPPAVG
jgi:hypothetical protein